LDNTHEHGCCACVQASVKSRGLRATIAHLLLCGSVTARRSFTHGGNGWPKYEPGFTIKAGGPPPACPPVRRALFSPGPGLKRQLGSGATAAGYRKHGDVHAACLSAGVHAALDKGNNLQRSRP
jgi:hypothetical protein